MIYKPKIILFILNFILTFLLGSCEKNQNDVIPDVYVDFYISLNDPEFFSLSAPLGFAYVDSKTNNYGQAAAGYNGNGIIVYQSGNYEFFAYDRTCPHDYVVNGTSVRINVTDMIYAECPECKTKYGLPNYGTPLPGYAGKYPLKNYKTSFDGINVHVWNR